MKTEQQTRVDRMMMLRRMQLHSVYKTKWRMTGCPLGDFDAYMESPHSLPLVIRGEAGEFNRAGTWIRYDQDNRL